MQVLFRVLVSIFQSVFISVIMFLIVYSLITQEFPPKFSKITSAWNGVQDLSRMGTQAPQAFLDHKSGDIAEDDVRQLEAINTKRQKVSEQFFSKTEEEKKTDSGSDENYQQLQVLRRDVQSLKNRVFDLEQELKQIQKK